MQLIGIFIIIIGFMLKLDTIAVVIFAGLVTGLTSGMDFISLLDTLGTAFVDSRYMSIFLITLPVIGILERNGLRVSATRAILKLKDASAPRLLTIYMFLRSISSFFGVYLGGHVQFIRPVLYPMVESAVKVKEGSVSAQKTNKLKAISCAMDNFGNFFGQNVFIASPGVLLIVGTLSELGYPIQNTDVGRTALYIAFTAMLLTMIYNIVFTKMIIGRKD